MSAKITVFSRILHENPVCANNTNVLFVDDLWDFYSVLQKSNLVG
jgi:hypothetical protein